MIKIINIELKPKFEDEADSIFGRFSKYKRTVLLASEKRWLPAADVFETDTDFVIILDLAHVNIKNIEISITERLLTIKGIREEITKFNKRHYHKMEIDYGPFNRNFDLPDAVDVQNIKSHYSDGFLEVRLKKVQERREKERVINIDWE